MQFFELAVGARFEFRGRHYQKTAMSMTQDERHFGNIFQGQTEVAVVGEPLLLPPEEAALWKPDDTYWADYLTVAPGESRLTREPRQE